MCNATLPASAPFAAAVVMPQGSLVAIGIPPAAFFALSAVQRYLLDQTAQEHFLSDGGDYCRIYLREHFETLCVLLAQAERDWKPAVFECWSEFDPSPTLRTAFDGPEELRGPVSAARFAGQEFAAVINAADAEWDGPLTVHVADTDPSGRLTVVGDPEFIQEMRDLEESYDCTPHPGPDDLVLNSIDGYTRAELDLLAQLAPDILSGDGEARKEGVDLE